ncbi:uncharacterized protein LOC144453160 [Glandiceps talaboti]
MKIFFSRKLCVIIILIFAVIMGYVVISTCIETLSRYHASARIFSTVENEDTRKLETVQNSATTGFGHDHDRNSNTFFQATIDKIMLQHPWLLKQNFIPNFYTRRDESLQGYKDENLSIVFVHYPKAGGRTMKSCLDDVARLQLYPKPTRLKVNVPEYPYNDIPAQKFYVSEFTFGICDTLQRPCSYFTILRDPFERLISLYNYCHLPIYDPICRVGDVHNSTIQEWSLYHGSHFFRQLLYNFQETCFESPIHEELLELVDNNIFKAKSGHEIPCWYLNKLFLQSRLTQYESEMLLKYILENLENWFTVIGMVDEYDLSLKMLEKAYGLPFVEQCTQVHIVAGKIENNEDVEIIKENDVMEKKRILMEDGKVQEALKFDILIYDKATEIFKRQKQKYLSML